MKRASGFIPHYSQVRADGQARKSCFILHGALGSGNNFRSIARALLAQRPDIEFVLVDLRLHGRSLDAPGPHTLKACADDLERLADHLGKPPEVVMGHSFGGKVALAYARQAGSELEQIWVLDSNPGAQGSEVADPEVVRVLSRLAEVPGPYESRDVAVRALEDLGISPATARWLGGNYERREQGYLLKLDVTALGELLANYFEDDYWPFLAEPRDSPEVHLVIAERSDRSSPALRRRAESLPAATRTLTHVLEDAGHWLHVDNPRGLVKLVLTHLPMGN